MSNFPLFSTAHIFLISEWILNLKRTIRLISLWLHDASCRFRQLARIKKLLKLKCDYLEKLRNQKLRKHDESVGRTHIIQSCL